MRPAALGAAPVPGADECAVGEEHRHEIGAVGRRRDVEGRVAGVDIVVDLGEVPARRVVAGRPAGERLPHQLR